MQPASDEASRAFLQKRVALFGKVMTAISVGGLLAQLITDVLITEELAAAPFLLSALTGVCSAAIWLSCRTGVRSVRFCRIAEGGGLLATITLVMLIARSLVPVAVAALGGVEGDVKTAEPGTLTDQMSLANQLVLMSVLIGINHACVVRAALVPSPPLYTAFLTATVFVPMVTLYVYGLAPTEVEEAISRQLTMGARHDTLVQGGTWWCFTIGVCTVISHVIYGLRLEIREAQKLGQYTLEEKLGEGGMGVVYRARHALMRRPTAVKLLPASATGDESLKRFEREVRLTARLTHPNTITVFDYGHTPDGVFYYAMELLDGASLAEVVDLEGRMPPERVAAILVQVGGALEEAHSVGLIHRDIKPGNVFLCTRGGIPDVAKLLDFGLVKDVHAAADVAVTQDGSITGTPLYMAPESVTSPDEVDARADLYSLGAVAYFLLTGEHVFDGRTPVEVLGHHLHTEPTPPSERVPGVPEALEALVLACLNKDPDARPANARALVERLEATGLPSRWTRAEAERWWTEHAESLRRKTGRPPAPARTLEIDLGQRSAVA